MRIHCLALVLALVGASLSVPQYANAQWQYEENVAVMTDETKRRAVVVNEKGHSFSVYRVSEGEHVWANFSISSDSFDQIDSDKPPMLRVDKHAPLDLQEVKKLGALLDSLEHVKGSSYQWEPKWVNFLIWHGDVQQGLAAFLIQVMQGEKLTVRYYLPTGGYKDTVFSLVGSAPVIAQALDIPLEIDTEVEDARKAAKQAWMDSCTAPFLLHGKIIGQQQALA